MDEQKNQMKDIDIHNCHIDYSENDSEVIYFLERQLDQREFYTLFDHARLHGEAFFQNKERHHYKITYKEGKYNVVEV